MIRPTPLACWPPAGPPRLAPRLAQVRRRLERKSCSSLPCCAYAWATCKGWPHSIAPCPARSGPRSPTRAAALEAAERPARLRATAGEDKDAEVADGGGGCTLRAECWTNVG